MNIASRMYSDFRFQNDLCHTTCFNKIVMGVGWESKGFVPYFLAILSKKSKTLRPTNYFLLGLELSQFG